MRIGYFADGEWSHKALENIITNKDFSIEFIVARFENPDPILEKYAKQLDVPFLFNNNVNSDEFRANIKKYDADIYVSMSFNQILKSDIINMPPKGFINCHAGALPFYRGRNILNWALINGEKQFGVTVHYIDAGIDTGDIILQKFNEITEDDNYGSLLKKAVKLCADTLYEALTLIRNDKVVRIEQKEIHPVGFYCGVRKTGDEWIDWNWSSERIYNFTRAISLPGPCARTYVNDQEIAILSAETIPNAPLYIGKPGEVVGRGKNFIIIKTGDSTIKINEIAYINVDGSFRRSRPLFTIGNVFLLNYSEIRLRQLEQKLLSLKQ